MSGRIQPPMVKPGSTPGRRFPGYHAGNPETFDQPRRSLRRVPGSHERKRMEFVTFVNAFTDTQVHVKPDHVSIIDAATADTTTITTTSGGRVTVKGTVESVMDALGKKKPGRKEMETR